MHDPMNPQPPPISPDDSFGYGMLITLAWQFNFILIGGFTMFLSRFGAVLFAYWGLIQWLVLAPLYFWQRGKGRQLAGKGILVAGCIGFLLNAGCDFMFGYFPFLTHPR